MVAYAPSKENRRPGTLSVQVVAREPVAGGAVTLWLARPGTQRAPAAYLPGQFITLVLPARGGGTVSRSYSLCGDGRSDRPWEITIKRQPGGQVSPYLCEQIMPGMVLDASAPSGHFTLPAPVRPDIPLVLVATGSGITPMVGLLRAIARLAPGARPHVQLHYAYHRPADAIYGCELAALDPHQQWLRQRHYVSTAGSRLTSARVLAAAGGAATTAEWYICGTPSLKADLAAELLRHGVPQRQVHYETFASPRTPPVAQPPSSAQQKIPGARLRLAESGATLAGQPGETVLETLERCGYAMPYSCRAGACGTCRLRLLAGDIRNGEGDGLTDAERAQGDVLSCLAEPEGEVVLAGAARYAPRAHARGSARATRPATRRAGRLAVRSGLLAASLALFVGAGRQVLQTAGARTTSGSSNSSNSSQSSSTTGTSGSSSSNSSSSSSSSSSSGSSSSGSSSVSTGSSQPSATNTSSGVS